MKKIIIFSAIFISSSFSNNLCAMLTSSIIKRIKPLAHAPKQYSTWQGQAYEDTINHQYQTVDLHEYDIDPHFPYSSLRYPHSTLFNINKFLSNQPIEYAHPDIKEKAKRVQSALVHQAETIKKIVTEMETTIDKRNKSIPLLTKLLHTTSILNNMRYEPQIFKIDSHNGSISWNIQQKENGDYYCDYKKQSWGKIIKRLYEEKQYKKQYKIRRKMPFGGTELWKEHYQIINKVIEKNRDEFHPYYPTDSLATLFIHLKHEDLYKLDEASKKLEFFPNLQE